MLEGKSILVTGGTGTFGNKFAEIILRDHKIKRLVILSRGEEKQYNMAKKFDDPRLRFFIGDVRDKERLRRAFNGIDIVIHAAAMKHVPICEYNPFEAIKTNIMGAENIIEAAIDSGVEKVVALSTDKAVNPINLYGATKLASDKLFISANSYSGKSGTKFCVVRYGNVIGSSGSVIPLFKSLKEKGEIPITDERMTRFWLPLEEGVELVVEAVSTMTGGETYVRKVKSMKIVDLAKAIAPEAKLKEIGIRPGEKLHEIMITEDDSVKTFDYKWYYIIYPQLHWWTKESYFHEDGIKVPDRFSYSSDTNMSWYTKEEIEKYI